MTQFDQGFIVGFFAAHGNFGGDGRTPQLTLRLGSESLPILERLVELLPGSRIYGPYRARGAEYWQWTLRAAALEAAVQSDVFLPLQSTAPTQFEKYSTMLDGYFRDGKLKRKSST